MIDYIKLFDDYNVDYATEGKNVGRDFIGLHCPWCGDSSYHGGVPKNGSEVFRCWRCGGHGLKQSLSIIMGIREIDMVLDNYRDSVEIVEKIQNSWVLKGCRFRVKACNGITRRIS